MKYAKALEIIKAHEGCKLEAYWDSGKPPVATIGYGTTVYPSGAKVKIGDKISLAMADEYLESHFNSMVPQVEKLLHFPLTDEQMNAVLSLVYNIGIGNFRDSTLLRKLNDVNSKLEDSGNEFLRWNHDNGKVVAGLTNRRIAERDLFLS